MKLGTMPPRDLALLAVAVVLMLSGAMTLVLDGSEQASRSL